MSTYPTDTPPTAPGGASMPIVCRECSSETVWHFDCLCLDCFIAQPAKPTSSVRLMSSDMAAVAPVTVPNGKRIALSRAQITRIVAKREQAAWARQRDRRDHTGLFITTIEATGLTPMRWPRWWGTPASDPLLGAPWADDPTTITPTIAGWSHQYPADEAQAA